MSRPACQAVPALACVLLGALLAPGCYLDHGLGPSPGPGPIPGPGPTPVTDAGPPPRPLDAGPRPDADPPPPSCVGAAFDFACTDTGNAAIPVGVPYALPVYLGGPDSCLCGEEIRCRGDVPADGVLDLSTYVCAEGLCEACLPYVRGTCELPPLEAGTWRVRVNGLDAFDLEVSDASPIVGPVDQCQTRPSDALGCGTFFDPRLESVDQICVANESIAGAPIAVRVTDFCRSCADEWGPCRVTRSASSIRVEPTSMPSACDVECPEVCSFGETTCFIPPLEPGTYDVSVAGLDATMEIHVLPDGIVRPGSNCLSLPED